MALVLLSPDQAWRHADTSKVRGSLDRRAERGKAGEAVLRSRGRPPLRGRLPPTAAASVLRPAGTPMSRWASWAWATCMIYFRIRFIFKQWHWFVHRTAPFITGPMVNLRPHLHLESGGASQDAVAAMGPEFQLWQQPHRTAILSGHAVPVPGRVGAAHFAFVGRNPCRKTSSATGPAASLAAHLMPQYRSA